MKYFKHDLSAREDDKVFELIEAHGIQGYGLWWVVLEEIYKSEESGFQITATDAWFKRLSKSLNMTDWRTLIRVLDTMAELRLIDPQLWAEHTIYSPGIAKRADAYVQKKELAAERKRRQRERDRDARELMSRVTDAGHRDGHASGPIYTDPEIRDQIQIHSDQRSPLTPLGRGDGLDAVDELPVPMPDRKPEKKSRKRRPKPERAPLVPGQPIAARDFTDKQRQARAGFLRTNGIFAPSGCDSEADGVQKVFEFIGSPEGEVKFREFWTWYLRPRLKPGCDPKNPSSWEKLPKAAGIDDKVQAAIAYAILWESNFLGFGLDGFRRGCKQFLDEVKAKDGLGMPAAFRFLLGSQGNSPKWVSSIHGFEPSSDSVVQPFIDDALSINPVLWQDTYNENRPDGWADCDELTQGRMEGFLRGYEAAGCDESKALMMLAVGLQYVRVSPDAKWLREREWSVDKVFASDHLDDRFVAWYEKGKTKNLNPEAVAVSGLDEAQIAQAQKLANLQRLVNQ